MVGVLCAGFCVETFAQDAVFSFGGKVVDKAGKGIAGVVVNDGMSFTQTDAKGAWSLRTDTTRSKFVSISTPAAYELPQQDGLAAGHYVSCCRNAARCPSASASSPCPTLKCATSVR